MAYGAAEHMTFYHPQWPVYFEDNHVLALYKPAGLVVQRDYKNKANLLDLVKSWIKIRYGKPGNVFAGMVHRLDAPVAGVMVVARTSKAASRLSAQFRQGRVEKRYLAVVHGSPPDGQGYLEHHLMRRGRLSRAVTEPDGDSKKACLHYSRLGHRDGRSLLDIRLETGRRHQIRAQLGAVGCAIVGDVRYGARNPLRYGRIALLARSLAFDHPTRAVRLHLVCNAPVHWPWPAGGSEGPSPLWSIEEYQRSPAGLPFDPQTGAIF